MIFKEQTTSLPDSIRDFDIDIQSNAVTSKM